MLDFEIKNEQLPVIQVNFLEIKQALTNTMQQYKGIIVTEEGLSACKTTQKELASMRVKIDNYRKDKKKELSKPITDFENQCKELITLIEKAEQPIKEGISVFDNKKREEKRQLVLSIIQEVIEAHQLDKKYADKLNVLDKYLNFTASYKNIKEDIEQRAYFLIEEQLKEQQMLEVIKATIENANKNIRTQVTLSDVQYLINMNVPVSSIIDRINQMSEKIRLAEIPKEKPKQEPVNEVNQETDIEPKQAELVHKQTQPEVKEPEKLYFIELRIIGTSKQTAELGQYMRSNKYNYEVLNKGAVS